MANKQSINQVIKTILTPANNKLNIRRLFQAYLVLLISISSFLIKLSSWISHFFKSKEYL